MNGVENLLFACNAVLPTFAIILLGSSLKKIGVLQDTLIQQGNTLCFQVLFPILVFFNIYAAEKINISYLKLVVIALTVIAVSLLILLFVVPRVTTDRRRMSVLIQSIYRGNFMLYGLPFSQVLGGADSAAMATSIMAATLPVLNTIGVFVYSFFSEVKGKPDLKGAAVQSVKNHILWGGHHWICFSHAEHSAAAVSRYSRYGSGGNRNPSGIFVVGRTVLHQLRKEKLESAYGRPWCKTGDSACGGTLCGDLWHGHHGSGIGADLYFLCCTYGHHKLSDGHSI